jgi:hypothetical protein
MKKLLLSLFVISLISCQPSKEQKPSPNMDFGGWSGISDDHSKESLMAREFNEYYVTNTFQKGASMISDDADEFFFNNDKVTKQGWLDGASAHHNYFDNISNDKIQPYNLTTTRYDNGQVWTLCWFIWTGKGKYTETEAQILVHYGFRWKDDKIVAAYHFFDPTPINNEIAAASEN